MTKSTNIDNKKLLISYIIAFLVLALGVMGKNALSKKKEWPPVLVQKEVSLIFVDKVHNEDKAVQALPVFDDQQEKLFIIGKGILTAYYSVKNLQERLSKYTIYAPFNGILTSANVNKGTLISPGQRLGTFISPNIDELKKAKQEIKAELTQNEQLKDITDTDLLILRASKRLK